MSEIKTEPVIRVRLQHVHTLCECGCGNPAPLAKRSRPYLGHVKGEPMRFINGHNRRRYSPDEDGFWSRVDRSGGQDACWPWIGPCDEFGYGRMYWQGTTTHSHRVAYGLAKGPLPVDRPQVRHTCDNPPCNNPAHLIPGTTQENTADRQERERQSRGASRWSAKLTEAVIPGIRERRASGELLGSIAADYGVAYQTIQRAVLRKTWRHVA